MGNRNSETGIFYSKVVNENGYWEMGNRWAWIYPLVFPDAVD